MADHYRRDRDPAGDPALSCQSHLPMIEAFCNAIEENRPPEVGAEAAWRVQRNIDAVYRNTAFTSGEPP